MSEKVITYIEAEHIRPHPDNPRKELGDLSELTESIKKNGILQNLTVIPVDGEPGEYMTIIGHRRYAAGTKAGVTVFPCQIAEGLSKREQMGIMLEENMQRNDLTIWEQAYGFQMMLDLGETEESIAEKTGFSKTTVKRRLNIAKLDQKLLKEKEKNVGFQLTLTDLYALEQIEDISIRNKVLREATDSRNLVWKAQQEAREIQISKNEKALVKLLEEAGCQKAPKDYEKTRYTNRWEHVKYMDLDGKVPERINKSEVEGCFYYRSFGNMQIVRERPKEKKKETEWEKAQKERERRKKKIKEIVKEMEEQRELFVRSILSGKTEPVPDTEPVIEGLWKSIVLSNGYWDKLSLAEFLSNSKNWYDLETEAKEEALKKLAETRILHQMMIAACVSTKGLEFMNYDSSFKEITGEAVTIFTDVLAAYGFTYSDEEYYKVMEGSCELYEKEEK